jgi:hypothetical protein
MFDYNTTLVIQSAGLLGVIAGMVGVYLLLRKRSLIGDAICHAALPGLAIAFLTNVAWGGNGKSLVWLLIGAALSGTAGSLAVIGLRRWSNLKEDAALGIVLSVFFGIGTALFSIVQQSEGDKAGLENFILGKTASIVASDADSVPKRAETPLLRSHVGLGARLADSAPGSLAVKLRSRRGDRWGQCGWRNLSDRTPGNSTCRRPLLDSFIASYHFRERNDWRKLRHHRSPKQFVHRPHSIGGSHRTCRQRLFYF